MKRSHAVSLVLLAGAGAAAFGLARLDPTQDEEDVLLFRSDQDCIDRHDRSDVECRRDFQAAQQAYRASAPRYADRATCEAHHGVGRCRPASDLDLNDTSGAYVPLLAAYMVGRLASQNMPVQPLYQHDLEADRQAGGTYGYGGYCSGTGVRVSSARTGVATTAPRSATRGSTTTPRVIARGGFGFTGRSVGGHGGDAHGSSGT